MRRELAFVAVLVASLAGGLVAVWSFSAEKRLPAAGTVRVSVEPFHPGALDVYVPVVDWGVRFDGVRAPARLRVEVRTVDRAAATRLAEGGVDGLRTVRAQAADAIASYLRALALIAAAAALALGTITALAMRRRLPVALALVVAIGWAAAVALALPPRGNFLRPEYYAHGSDIPIALRAVEAATTSADRLGEELDSQIVGLARLVAAPAARASLQGLPRLTVASDLHNNVVGIPTLARASDGGPVLFAGDMTDRGSPIEASVTRQVVQTGRPFVFVAGNHDSDVLSQQLADEGAIVLDQRGRLLPDGRHGRVVNVVGGLRVAGYTDPNERIAADDYRDRGATVTADQQADFLAWVLSLLGKVDVIMVHEPQLAEGALTVLRADPPESPLLFVVGHTHQQAVDAAGGVIEVNGGTVGAGGTGNLTEGSDLGLAVVAYSRNPFVPLAADLVVVDPATGDARAQRVRLDAGVAHAP